MPDRDPVEPPRVTLPKNLSETLKRLEDAELETLLREVIGGGTARSSEARAYSRSAANSASPQVPGAAEQGFGCAGRPSSGEGKPHQGISLGRHEASSNRPYVPPLAIDREQGFGYAGEVKEVTV
jgi:hypothetical protein